MKNKVKLPRNCILLWIFEHCPLHILLIIYVSQFSTVFCMYGKESLTKGKKEIEILFCHRRYRKRVKNGKLFDSSQIKYCHRAFCASACDHVFWEEKIYGNNVYFLRFSGQIPYTNLTLVLDVLE